MNFEIGNLVKGYILAFLTTAPVRTDSIGKGYALQVMAEIHPEVMGG